MQSIGHKIWTIEGKTAGPHLMILGGVHGNELTGIHAVRGLLKRFGADGERLRSGRLTIAFGNPEAIRRNTRGSAPYQDLNRCFTAERLAAPTLYEEQRAAELAPHIASADFLVDLHAVNTPSDPFVVATAHDDGRMLLGSAFSCGTFLVAPDEIISGTTDGWIAKSGGTGIGYESGYMKDLTRLADVKAGLDRIMKRLGLIAGSFETKKRQAIVTIREPILLDGETFMFAENHGKTSFEPFAKGETLGFLDGRPVTAPFTGELIFPKPKRLHSPGAPVGFLAVKKKTRP